MLMRHMPRDEAKRALGRLLTGQPQMAEADREVLMFVAEVSRHCMVPYQDGHKKDAQGRHLTVMIVNSS